MKWLALLLLTACASQPRPSCSGLAQDAERKINALTVCKDTPGCTFNVADLEAALAARDAVQACKP